MSSSTTLTSSSTSTTKSATTIASLAFAFLASATMRMKAKLTPSNKSFLKNHFATTCFLPLPTGLQENQ